MSKIEELKERVLKYRMLQLPGQPMAAHMGTSYLIGDLLAAVEEYATELDKYVDELMDVDARADRLQAENASLKEDVLKNIAYYQTKEYEIMTVPHIIIANMKKIARDGLKGSM